MVESFLNSSSLLANQGTIPQLIITSSRSPVSRLRRMTGWVTGRDVVVRRDDADVVRGTAHIEVLGNLLLVEEAVVAATHSALRRPAFMLQKNPQRLTNRTRLCRVKAALRLGILPTHDIIGKLVIRY